MINRMLKAIFMMLIMSGTALAAHPLITDDTGTNGKGKFQFELNSEFSYDSETSDGINTKEKSTDVKTSISWGVTDSADVILGIPYQWNRAEEDGIVLSDENGISDMSLELKWRIYERDGLSFAFKPGVTLPTGDEEKGVGTGRVCYSIFFITTQKIEPLALHVNIGYMHNEYNLEIDKDCNRKDLWHLSLAGTWEVIKNLQLAANIGIEKTADKNSTIDPAFALAGLIYSVTQTFDIDLAFKIGLTQSEANYALLTGLTFRF